MANEIDAALVIQFSDQLHVKAQQMQARLRPFVRIKKMSGDLWAFDGLGQVEAQELAGRVQPTTFNSIDHLRRKIRRRRFVVTLPIDSSDIRGVLLHPESEYATACIRALERVFDRVGIEAVFASVSTGRDMDTTVTYGNDGGTTVDATAGLTYNFLLEIQRVFTNNEVGTDVPEEMLALITGDEHEALMKETTLISGDFTRQFAVDKGQMTQALDYKLIKYGASVNAPLLSVSSGTRDNVFMSRRALCYGMSVDLKVDIKDRPDFVETTQVQAVIQLGAVRTEGVLTQKVQTTSN